MIERLAIVGVGLLGGSVAKAARAHGLAREIVGVGRDQARLRPAVTDGTLDRATTDLAEGLRGAERDTVPKALAQTIGVEERSIRALCFGQAVAINHDLVARLNLQPAWLPGR